jgi:hypothetical protein
MLRNDDCELKLARGGWLLGTRLPGTAAPELKGSEVRLLEDDRKDIEHVLG